MPSLLYLDTTSKTCSKHVPHAGKFKISAYFVSIAKILSLLQVPENHFSLIIQKNSLQNNFFVFFIEKLHNASDIIDEIKARCIFSPNVKLRMPNYRDNKLMSRVETFNIVFV